MSTASVDPTPKAPIPALPAATCARVVPDYPAIVDQIALMCAGGSPDERNVPAFLYTPRDDFISEGADAKARHG